MMVRQGKIDIPCHFHFSSLLSPLFLEDLSRNDELCILLDPSLFSRVAVPRHVLCPLSLHSCWLHQLVRRLLYLARNRCDRNWWVLIHFARSLLQPSAGVALCELRLDVLGARTIDIRDQAKRKAGRSRAGSLGIRQGASGLEERGVAADRLVNDDLVVIVIRGVVLIVGMAVAMARLEAR
jgi:hypothetical protein